MTHTMHRTALAIASVAILVTGCAKYRPHALHDPFFAQQADKPTAELQITAKELTVDDCKYVFSRNAIRKGYHVVQLSMRNNTNDIMSIETNEIGFDIAKRACVIEDLSLNKEKRFWLLYGPAVVTCFIPIVNLVAPLVLVTSSIVETYKCNRANIDLAKDLTDRVLDQAETVVVPPYMTLNKVVFTKQTHLPDSLHVGYRQQSSNDITWLNINIA